jgi:F0F1-type ATP synthase assembly protein I
MPGRQQIQRGDAARAYSLGFELVCAVAGFVLVGIWIDRHYSSGPWGTLVCLFLGLIGGVYNLIRGASRMASGPRPARAGGAASAPGSEREAPRASAGPRAAVPQPDQEAGRGEDPAAAPAVPAVPAARAKAGEPAAPAGSADGRR